MSDLIREQRLGPKLAAEVEEIQSIASRLTARLRALRAKLTEPWDIGSVDEAIGDMRRVSRALEDVGMPEPEFDE